MRSLGLLWGIALLIACSGESEPEAPQGGMGGSGSSSGAGGQASGGSGAGGTGGQASGGSSGAGGTGGTSSAGSGGGSAVMTRTEACIAYQVARHKRSDECGGNEPRSEAAYAREIVDCPDVFFSEGSTRTIESLLECAEAFRTIACNDLDAQRFPACVSDGTLTPGSPCTFGPQCDSLVCDGGDAMTCGMCLQRVPPGGACGSGFGLCPLGYMCSGEICVERPLDPPEPPDPPPAVDLPTGAECTSTMDCTGEDLCLSNEADVMVCMARIAVGGYCGGPNTYCFEADYCNEEHECAVRPGPGEPCGLAQGEPSACASGATCDREHAAGPTCVALASSACMFADLECPDDSICCVAPECDTPACIRIALPGEACGADLTRCIAGSECMGGTCQALDSTGVFEAICPG